MKVITTSSIMDQAGGLRAGVWPATCSACFPQTVRIQTRKVSVATITSQGWVAQNSPWLRNTFLTVGVSIMTAAGRLARCEALCGDQDYGLCAGGWI